MVAKFVMLFVPTEITSGGLHPLTFLLAFQRPFSTGEVFVHTREL